MPTESYTFPKRMVETGLPSNPVAHAIVSNHEVCMKLVRALHYSFPIVASLLLSQCVTSGEEGVTINPTVYEDDAYEDVYKKNTAQYKVITNFENRYEVYTTYLSQEFRNALGARYQRLFDERQPILEETGNKLGFFVSLYTMNKDVNDLTDQDLWNVILEENGQAKKPVVIKKLSKKERWAPFFPYITPWSKEYLILFEIPASGVPSEDFVKQSKIRLIFTNADGKVAIRW